MLDYSKTLAISLLSFRFLAPTHSAAQTTDFPATVAATKPLAFYRLNAISGKSQVGNTSYSSKTGVTIASPGAPIASSSGSYSKFDGKSGMILTTQSGGVGDTASMMAWINLAGLPSKEGHYFYVEGESEAGNDLDLQFEPDDVLHFYTAAGGRLDYKPLAASLLNQWHMVVVTLNTATRTRTIYWDGKLVAHDNGGGNPGKRAPFSVGASTHFSGRFFDGGIQDVALWNRSLSATEVAGIYASSKVSQPHRP